MYHIDRIQTPDFWEYLEYASVRRYMIKIQLHTAVSSWQTDLIEAISIKNGRRIIHLRNDLRVSEDDLIAAKVPFDTYDLDAIGCLCD